MKKGTGDKNFKENEKRKNYVPTWKFQVTFDL